MANGSKQKIGPGLIAGDHEADLVHKELRHAIDESPVGSIRRGGRQQIPKQPEQTATLNLRKEVGEVDVPIGEALRNETGEEETTDQQTARWRSSIHHCFRKIFSCTAVQPNIEFLPAQTRLRYLETGI